MNSVLTRVLSLAALLSVVVAPELKGSFETYESDPDNPSSSQMGNVYLPGMEDWSGNFRYSIPEVRSVHLRTGVSPELQKYLLGIHSEHDQDASLPVGQQDGKTSSTDPDKLPRSQAVVGAACSLFNSFFKK